MIAENRETTLSRLEINRAHAISRLDSYLEKPEERMLREYQMDAMSSLRDFLEIGETAGYINLTTGSGKSVIIAELAEAVGLKTLVLSPTIPILKQTGREFSTEIKVTQRGGGSNDLSGKVVNATYQSIEADIKKGRLDPTEFDFIICDEAHTALGNKRHKIFKEFPHALMLGLTATPYFTQIETYRKRQVIEEGERWVGMFENSVHEMGLEEGIEREILANLDVSIVRTGVKVGEMRNSPSGDYSEKDLDKYLNVWIRNAITMGILAGEEGLPEGAILSVETREEVRKLHEKIKGKRTVVFGISVDHIQDLARQLNLAGIKAKTIYAEGMTQEERDNSLKAYEMGEVDVLLGVDLLRIGWNSPDTEVGIYLAPTKSGVVATQELGRILRRTPDKDTAIAIQLADIFEGRGQSPILIPNIFDPYFVMRGSAHSRENGQRSVSKKDFMPKIRFSGIGIEAIIEEARSQELLRQRFGRASIEELDLILSEMAARIYSNNPEISPIEFYQAFADELPFRIGGNVIDRAREAVASIDSNTATVGKRVLQNLWIRQALTAAKPYLTGNIDYDSDLIQQGFSTFYEEIGWSKTQHRPVGVLVEKGIINFIAQKENVPVTWVKRRIYPLIKERVNEYLSDRSWMSVAMLANELSEETGEKPGRIIEYINQRTAEVNGPEKSGGINPAISAADNSHMIEEVRAILDRLSSREREVITLYYGIDGDEPKTFEEVGRLMGRQVTRERVRQVFNKGLKKLRHPSRAIKIKDFLQMDEIDLPIRMPVIEGYPMLEEGIRETRKVKDSRASIATSKISKRSWDEVIQTRNGNSRAISMVGVVGLDLETPESRQALYRVIPRLINRPSFPKILIEEFDPAIRSELREYLRGWYRLDPSYYMDHVISFIKPNDPLAFDLIRAAVSGDSSFTKETAVVARLHNIAGSLSLEDRRRIMGF